jgi:hypothetical protein
VTIIETAFCGMPEMRKPARSAARSTLPLKDGNQLFDPQSPERAEEETYAYSKTNPFGPSA